MALSRYKPADNRDLVAGIVGLLAAVIAGLVIFTDLPFDSTVDFAIGQGTVIVLFWVSVFCVILVFAVSAFVLGVYIRAKRHKPPDYGILFGVAR